MTFRQNFEGVPPSGSVADAKFSAILVPDFCLWSVFFLIAIRILFLSLVF